LPFVVIETKYGSFSTHDVLIYSTKALKHKEIYPYIRYGFVVGGIDEIYNNSSHTMSVLISPLR